MHIHDLPLWTFPNDIVDGKIPAGKINQAVARRCIRHIEEAYHESGKLIDGSHFYVDIEEAERLAPFFLKNYEINNANLEGRMPFKLHVSQEWFLQNWLGWKISADYPGNKGLLTGTPRFRSGHNEGAKGMAKTSLTAGMVGYKLVTCSHEDYQAAFMSENKDQAQYAMKFLQAYLRRLDQQKDKPFKWLKERKPSSGDGPGIVLHSTGQTHYYNEKMIRTGLVSPFAARAEGLSGYSFDDMIVEELHELGSEGALAYDLLKQSDKEKPGQILANTNTGKDRSGVYYNQRLQVERVANAAKGSDYDDDHFFGAVWCMDDDDDIFDMYNLRKANPILDLTPGEFKVRRAMKEARTQPSARAAFRRYYCGILPMSAAVDISGSEWDACSTNQALIITPDKDLYVSINFAEETEMLACTLMQDEHYESFYWWHENGMEKFLGDSQQVLEWREAERLFVNSDYYSMYDDFTDWLDKRFKEAGNIIHITHGPFHTTEARQTLKKLNIHLDTTRPSDGIKRVRTKGKTFVIHVHPHVGSGPSAGNANALSLRTSIGALRRSIKQKEALIVKHPILEHNFGCAILTKSKSGDEQYFQCTEQDMIHGLYSLTHLMGLYSYHQQNDNRPVLGICAASNI